MHTQNKRYHFFVIEDSRGDFAMVEEHLKRRFTRPTIQHAATFAEAETILKDSSTQFDAILLDLSLPDKSGEPVIDGVQLHAGDVPIVVVTGYPDFEFSLTAIEKGVSDYLLKDELTSGILEKSILYAIKRKHPENQVQTHNLNGEFGALFESIPLPALLVDHKTEFILKVNRAAVESYGYEKEELLSKGFGDIVQDYNLPEKKGNLTLSGEQNTRLFEGIQRHKKNNGSIFRVHVKYDSVQFKDGEATLITARPLENNLAEGEENLFQSVVENSSDAAIILDTRNKIEESKISYVNKAFTNITDFSAREADRKTIGLLFGEYTEAEEAEKLRNSIFHRESYHAELMLHQNDGTPFWADVLIDPILDEYGNCTHIKVTIRDISERKKEEKNLRDSLKEKELLLSEVHHRIKNNLALVSGMLQMQAFDEEDETVLNKLNNSMLRVEAMASIHQLLYESSSFSSLEFSKIVDKLVSATHKSFSSDKHIDVDIKTEPFKLNINQAIPCSLIINEAITNVYKHAFRDREEGGIKAELTREGKKVHFILEDDGQGLPEDFDISNLPSLGTKIIKALVKQLQGTFMLENRDEGGTRFKLEFEAKESVK